MSGEGGLQLCFSLSCGAWPEYLRIYADLGNLLRIAGD
jgi:hypothetical protein